MRRVLRFAALALITLSFSATQAQAHEHPDHTQSFKGKATWILVADTHTPGPEEKRLGQYEWSVNQNWTYVRITLAKQTSGPEILQLESVRNGSRHDASSDHLAMVELEHVRAGETIWLNVTSFGPWKREAAYTIKFLVVVNMYQERPPPRIVAAAPPLIPAPGSDPPRTPPAQPTREAEAAMAEFAKIAPSPEAGGPLWLVALLSCLLSLPLWWRRIVTGFAASWILFARLSRTEVLGHPRRRKLLALVEEESGIAEAALRRRSGISNGPFTYHLDLLVRHGVLTRNRIAGRWYVFQHGHEPHVVPEGLQTQIRRLLLRQPGLSQTRIAQRLGVSRAALTYHVLRLRREGRVWVERRGARTACFWTHDPDSNV